MGLIAKCGECGETRPLSSQNPPVCYKCAGKLNAAASSAPVPVVDEEAVIARVIAKIPARQDREREQERERDEPEAEAEDARLAWVDVKGGVPSFGFDTDVLREPEEPGLGTLLMELFALIALGLLVAGLIVLRKPISALIPKKSAPVQAVADEPVRRYLE